MDVVLSPSVPRWDYKPTGPYTLTRWLLCDPDIIYGCETHDTLAAMLRRFVRLHLPRTGEMCVIIDGDLQWVLGWRQTTVETSWAGCQGVFAMLEEFHNQVDVAYWEASARGEVLGQQADRVNE